MIDLGIYNFIRNALAQGQTKEAISGILTNQGMTADDIAAAFASVETGAVPTSAPTPLPSSVPDGFVTTTSGVEQWYDFRNNFWGYFITISVLAAIGKVIPFALISLAVLVLNLIFLMLIAIKVGTVTKAISGSRNIFLMALGFLLPPAAFFFAYRSARKYGWNVSLTLIEGVVVTIGMVLYALWAVFVITLLFTLALAAGPRVTISPSGVPTIDHSRDEIIVSSNVKSRLSQIRAEAELYYDMSGNSYGVSADCSSGMFVYPKIAGPVQEASTFSHFAPSCGSNGKAYAIQMKIKDGEYYCVDSVGKSKLGSTTMPNNTFACPE
jgi:hypothetical protein